MNRLIGIATLAFTLGFLPSTAQAQWEYDWYFDYFEPVDPVIQENYDLVGRDLNGEALDGTLLDGERLRSVGFAKVWINGKKNTKTTLVHGKFYGVNKGVAKQGQDFVGAEFEGRLDNNKKA